MVKKKKNFPVSLLEELHTSGAGHDVLRYVSLPDLLGTEANSLLYFMGRNLGRKFDMQIIEDIYYFFEKIGWGKLELIKEKRNEWVFHLLSDAVVYRLHAPFEAEFRLESGFLAEAVQKIENCECECVEKINHKIHQIEFRIVFTGN